MSHNVSYGLPLQQKARLNTPKRFRVAQVSSLSQTKSETSLLEGPQRHRLIKNFKNQSSFIQNKVQAKQSKSQNFGPPRSPRFQDSIDKEGNKLFGDKPAMKNSFRSGITGIDESKLMMKKSVGRFSRLERFRMRAKSGIVSKRGKTTSRPRKTEMADSVFGTVNNIKSTTLMGKRFPRRRLKNFGPGKKPNFQQSPKSPTRP